MMEQSYIKISEAFKLKSGLNLSAKNMEQGNHCVYGGNGISGYHNKYNFEESKIIIGRVGAHCGNIHLTKPKSWITDNALYIDKYIVEYNEDYLLYALRNVNLNQYASQSGQPLISAGRIKDVLLPLPPLETQKKIAAILDAADAYRQKTKALIAKYEELTQSLFLEMFGDPVRNEMGWEKKQLNDLLIFLTSGSRGWAKYYSFSGTIFLRIQNVGYNKLRLEDLTYVKAPSSAEAKRTLVEAGDVLLSITADLGRSAVVPEDFPVAHISQHLAILRLKKEVNPNYVSAYISSNGGQTLFLKLDKGGVKAGLNFTDIKSYEIMVPPISLQNQFATRIQKIKAQKAQAQQSFEKAEELFNSLLQRAFKGELV